MLVFGFVYTFYTILRLFSTHRTATQPEQPLATTIFRESFHSWRTLDALGCGISGCVVIFLGSNRPLPKSPQKLRAPGAANSKAVSTELGRRFPGGKTAKQLRAPDISFFRLERMEGENTTRCLEVAVCGPIFKAIVVAGF